MTPQIPNERSDSADAEPGSMPSAPAPPAGSGSGSGNASRVQLRFFQVLCLLLVVALLGGGGYFWYRQRHLQPVTILVAGRPTVTVANYAAALSVVREAELSGLGAAYAAGGDPRTAQEIAFQHVGDTSTLDTEADAAAQLARLLHVTVNAAVITVNGKRAVALPDEATAQAALDAVQQHYAAMPPNDPLYGKPAFQEHVEIKTERVPVSLCKASADQAAALMLEPPKGKNYTVESGDTGWRIARKFHISLSSFLRANAGRDVNKLAPGDVVNVAVTLPPLTVTVQKQTTSVEPIIAGATDGTGGERAVTDLYTYVNGVRQSGSTPVSSEILRRATPRRDIE